MPRLYSVDVGSPVDTTPEEQPPFISSIAELVNDDPELTQAVESLVYFLEHAYNTEAEDLAWETFTDRVKYFISRAKRQLANPMGEL